MDCCKSEKQKELKKAEEKEDKESPSKTSDDDEADHRKSAKNILAWGVGAVLIVGLLAMLL